MPVYDAAVPESGKIDHLQSPGEGCNPVIPCTSAAVGKPASPDGRYLLNPVAISLVIADIE
ncbi:MAG TPA: hypothetical protein EYO33_23940 [Phycisphaerales bacterium]|nr:hypothetical protein [Phycisphaerales bacterium]|tara:strand:- start:2243 stop:2425 length:183 start_codon:yes stop_codon:yes gene_type:complete